MLPNTNTHNTSDTSSHNSLCSVVHYHIYQANHVFKHTEFFSVDILLFWLPGRVAGPEAGPRRKWQGIGPALSIAGAATGCSVYERSAVVRRSQIFCGSRSASAHLRWSRDVNKLNGKYVKINSQRTVCNSENLT